MMRRSLRSVVLVALFFASLMHSPRTAGAQITIDRSWFESRVGEQVHSIYGLGKLSAQPLSTEHESEVRDIIDNQVGPDATYDFTGLPFELRSEFTAELSSDVESVVGSDDPAFSTANFASVTPYREVVNGDTLVGTAAAFFELSDGALRNLGSYIDAEEQFTITYSPPDTQYALPLTAGTAWSSSTTHFRNGSSFDITSSVEVEGYGMLLLPGGLEVEALRIRTTRQYSTASDLEITYEFLTLEGAIATIALSQADGETETTLTAVTYLVTFPSTAVGNPESLPEDFLLEQNYPNPFNPQTLIPFELSTPAQVTLRIFDVTGREVDRLIDARLPAGRHEVAWSAGDRPSGTYYYRLDVGAETFTRPLVLMR